MNEINKYFENLTDRDRAEFYNHAITSSNELKHGIKSIDNIINSYRIIKNMWRNISSYKPIIKFINEEVNENKFSGQFKAKWILLSNPKGLCMSIETGKKSFHMLGDYHHVILYKNQIHDQLLENPYPLMYYLRTFFENQDVEISLVQD